MAGPTRPSPITSGPRQGHMPGNEAYALSYRTAREQHGAAGGVVQFCRQPGGHIAPYLTQPIWQSPASSTGPAAQAQPAAALARISSVNQPAPPVVKVNQGGFRPMHRPMPLAMRCHQRSLRNIDEHAGQVAFRKGPGCRAPVAPPAGPQFSDPKRMMGDMQTRRESGKVRSPRPRKP